MRKFYVLFLIITLLMLSGCQNKTEFSSPSYQIIEYPNETAERTLDGYRDYDFKKEEKEIVYYGNKKSKVFHLSDCQYALKINEASIIFDRDRNLFINKGYTPCGACNP